MNFHLGLTRPQLEFLCAVADDCEWDRFTYGMGSGPNNFIATGAALEKRGLIQQKPRLRNQRWNNVYEIRATHQLTPAGKLVAELLKITGLFIESDSAISRKAEKRG
jgi:hypothetical protein